MYVSVRLHLSHTVHVRYVCIVLMIISTHIDVIIQAMFAYALIMYVLYCALILVFYIHLHCVCM